MISRRRFIRLTGMAGFGLALPPLFACGGSSSNPDAGTNDALAVDGGSPLPDSAPGTPWWMRGNYGPVHTEVDETNFSVTGTIPTELDGVYMRNGPNPKEGQSSHWFLGEGMFHGVSLAGGGAAWYRNRYARTPLYNDMPFGGGGFPDVRDTHANTALVHHAQRILALYEVGLPFEIGADLSSVGVYDFDGQLTTAMSAHPKIDPVSGEMFFHGYSALPPFLTYHRVDASGTLVASEEITTQGASMMHDMQLTESYAIFMDLPIVFDFSLVGSGMPYKWDDEYGARIGIMPRAGTNDDVTWFDIDPCYVFHTLNAYESGDDVIIEGARHDRLWVDGPNMFASEPALHRWTLNTVSNNVTETQLDDRNIEFPQVAASVRGRQHRYGYCLRFGDSADGVGPGPGTGVLKYDLDGDTVEAHDFGTGMQPDEPLFVPHPDGGAEDRGWLLSFVYDHANNRSRLAILDAQDMGAPPVAEIHLPQRVPFGFHGLWVPS